MQPIQDCVEKIAKKFSPKRIILFGSHAYGNPGKDSDVDILVIMATILPPVEQAVEIRKFVDFPFSVDLLVRTPEQVEQRIALGDPFFREVMGKGRVVYEADHD